MLERSGWARSVAGVGPYLTLFSRAGIGRAAADAALAALALHELPSARGCTYVLPAADFALGLAVGQPFGGAELKLAAKLGVTAKEIDRLKVAIAKALATGPLDPDGLREAVGGAARSLGEEGKKKGLNSTLPVALGILQSEGEIRRIPTNGRLDQQRYRYALWRPNPSPASASRPRRRESSSRAASSPGSLRRRRANSKPSPVWGSKPRKPRSRPSDWWRSPAPAAGSCRPRSARLWRPTAARRSRVSS